MMLARAFLCLAATTVLLTPVRASACGCVVSSNTATPVVQAGERILFAVENGIVTAHIQIQYQGAPEDFAWLVPVPKVPALRVGSDEVFTALEKNTTPQFVLTTLPPSACPSSYRDNGSGGGFGCGSDEAAFSPERFSADTGAQPYHPPPDIAVVRATAGPYEYAVLRADDKTEILAWLEDNRYFVPTDTDSVLDPYVHPGAYFLALKLKAGETTGSIRPVVLEYESDFPMIPIVLTSVAATPDMGILVWILGEARAIPRNYQHVVINEERLDWQNQASNYGALVKDAIDEAESHHAFVTEYVGISDPIPAALGISRLPNRQPFDEIHDRDALLQTLRVNFDWEDLTPILKRFFPQPAEIAVSETEFYANLEHYLRLEQPQPTDYDGAPLIEAIWAELVTPLLEASALFERHPKLTRLYTVLSPEEMTADPVFAFNADLPDFSNVHRATYSFGCDGNASITLESGRRFLTADATGVATSGAPLLARLELLREEGPPTVLVDNLSSQESSPQPVEGCSSTGRSAQGLGDLALLLALVGFASRRRRSKSL